MQETTNQPTLTVPTRRAKDVAEASRQLNLKDGTYRFLVVGPATFRAGYGDEGKHRLEVSFPVAPLGDPRDANSVRRTMSVFAKIVAPYGIGDDAPAIDQKKQKKAVTFFNAIFGDEVIPQLPRYPKGAEGEQAVAAALDAVTAKISELMANPGLCVNWAVDAKLGTFEYEAGKTCRTFQFYTEDQISKNVDWSYDVPVAL
jgi:hypothetical protein